MLPSSLYIMRPNQLQSFEVATFNGLGGDTFTRNVTDGRRTDFGTKLIYHFFLKKKAGMKYERILQSL